MKQQNLASRTATQELVSDHRTETLSLESLVNAATLLVSGAVVGYYFVKATGLIGVDVTSLTENIGMAAGACLVGILKLAHKA